MVIYQVILVSLCSPTLSYTVSLEIYLYFYLSIFSGGGGGGTLI